MVLVLYTVTPNKQRQEKHNQPKLNNRKNCKAVLHFVFSKGKYITAKKLNLLNKKKKASCDMWRTSVNLYFLVICEEHLLTYILESIKLVPAASQLPHKGRCAWLLELMMAAAAAYHPSWSLVFCQGGSPNALQRSSWWTDIPDLRRPWAGSWCCFSFRQTSFVADKVLSLEVFHEVSKSFVSFPELKAKSVCANWRSKCNAIRSTAYFLKPLKIAN